MQNTGVILAFDFGLARTGVAVGSELLRTATPLLIIDAQTNEARWEAISRLVEQWQPTRFVVGVPRHGDGSANDLTLRCERFARQLGGRYRCPVSLVDERYSSVVVEQGREKIDDRAAAVILQQYFEEHPTTES